MTTTASSTHGKNKSTTSLIKNPSFWRGLILATFIALLSLFLADTTLIKQYGLSALTIAIVIGFFIGNTIFPAISSSTISGVDFSKSRLLRIGIVLYGFRITFQQITDVGWSGLAIVSDP
ncbi:MULTISPECIES: putative sulfate exporter family transporter [unclassified Pseudomonas]|uniref:putative sulfate exporter family transporter n=1 Tax=unclassified Pseudomonas TaxID=196821 RepID=UPI0030D80E3D